MTPSISRLVIALCIFGGIAAAEPVADFSAIESHESALGLHQAYSRAPQRPDSYVWVRRVEEHSANNKHSGVLDGPPRGSTTENGLRTRDLDKRTPVPDKKSDVKTWMITCSEVGTPGECYKNPARKCLDSIYLPTNPVCKEHGCKCITDKTADIGPAQGSIIKVEGRDAMPPQRVPDERRAAVWKPKCTRNYPKGMLCEQHPHSKCEGGKYWPWNQACIQEYGCGCVKQTVLLNRTAPMLEIEARSPLPPQLPSDDQDMASGHTGEPVWKPLCTVKPPASLRCEYPRSRCLGETYLATSPDCKLDYDCRCVQQQQQQPALTSRADSTQELEPRDPMPPQRQPDTLTTVRYYVIQCNTAKAPSSCLDPFSECTSSGDYRPSVGNGRLCAIANGCGCSVRTRNLRRRAGVEIRSPAIRPASGPTRSRRGRLIARSRARRALLERRRVMPPQWRLRKGDAGLAPIEDGEGLSLSF
ncbi:hypothetical protein ACCO45_008952 [Purpureocillium lilacinum]|uniref:Uncharacterized protein n=1 Tax=Purpureocillium lilacinum TaxID=33203 RepID=A0ACC4DIL7_PURLI